jgi:predicted outer membrane protein
MNKAAALPCLLLFATAPLLAQDQPPKKPGRVLLPQKWNKLIQDVPSPAGAGEGISSSPLSGRDLEFLTTAIQTGRQQIELCALAKDKASTPEVRALGSSLGELNASQMEYLLDLAKRKGVVVENASRAAQKKRREEWAKIAGLKFDKEIADRILANEQRAVAAYEAASGSEDAEVKTRAQELLPIAKANLQLAGKVSGHSQDTSATPIFRSEAPVTPRETPTPVAAPPIPAATPAPVAKPSPPAPVAPAAMTPPPRPEGPKPIPFAPPTKQ